MSSKAITEKPESESAAPDYKAPREWAPSVMAAEEPTLARWAGGFGLAFVLFGVVALAFQRVSTTVGGMAIIVGVLGMLYNAVRDSDLVIRRLYGFFGFLLLAGGIVAAIVTATAYETTTAAAAVWLSGVGFILSLPFLLALVRNEDEPAWRQAALGSLGLVGAVAALLGMGWGTCSTSFMLSYGLPLALLGLIYLWAFIGLQDGTKEIGIRAGLVMGALGLLVFAIALVRWLLPTLFSAVERSWGWQPPGQFLASVGILQIAVGLLYVGVAAALCSESSFIVMTRRELAAFFFSPLAYVITFISALLASYQFLKFVNRLAGQAEPEPIIMGLVIDWFPVISVLFFVPLLTMRLFSEEHRSGRMEVLLTAPVRDPAIVLSKFAAVLIVYMLVWAPYAFFMVALRVEGGQPFDYRPIISFAVALLCSGAGFMAMGLFFSSLTRSQVLAAILTALGMIVLFAIYFIKAGDVVPAGSAWSSLLSYISYFELWINALQGKLSLKDVAFHISAAVVWLFLTVKVLESRKWR
jgi:ABC-2 type transport system permease protein